MAGAQASEANNASQSMSLMDALSWSTSGAQSSSQGTSSAGSYVDPAQAAARGRLFEGAMGAMDPGGARAAAAGAAGPAAAGLRRDFDRLGGMMNPDQYIRDQGKVLQADLGRMFKDEINPQIRGGAIASGGFGGGRQGVAEGVAAGQMAGQYARGLGDIRREGFGLALDASAQRAGLSRDLMGLSLAPFEAELGQLGQLGQILGPATVLSRSRSRNTGRSTSRGRSGSTNSARSSSQSSGQSQSAGFSLW